MAESLSPSERVLRARIAAHTMHALHDPKETTKAACAANPSSITWHERQVDPTGNLPADERRRRAEHHRKAYFARLALASAKARRRHPGDAA